MRMTSTTSSPVITKDTTAAGPADLMTPPRAIIVMCRCFKLWRKPLEGAGVSFIAESSSRAAHPTPRCAHGANRDRAQSGDAGLDGAVILGVCARLLTPAARRRRAARHRIDEATPVTRLAESRGQHPHPAVL